MIKKLQDCAVYHDLLLPDQAEQAPAKGSGGNAITRSARIVLKRMFVRKAEWRS
jgi:hypothetical protein